MVKLVHVNMKVHLNEVPMHLTLWTYLNKLVIICLHGQPKIASPHDLTG